MSPKKLKKYFLRLGEINNLRIYSILKRIVKIHSKVKKVFEWSREMFSTLSSITTITLRIMAINNPTSKAFPFEVLDSKIMM